MPCPALYRTEADIFYTKSSSCRWTGRVCICVLMLDEFSDERGFSAHGWTTNYRLKGMMQLSLMACNKLYMTLTQRIIHSASECGRKLRRDGIQCFML